MHHTKKTNRMDSNFERAKSSSKMKWSSGGHGQSIGLPSVVKAVIHCHTETFLQKSKELVNKFLLKYALLTAQAKVFLKTNKIDSNFERA